MADRKIQLEISVVDNASPAFNKAKASATGLEESINSNTSAMSRSTAAFSSLNSSLGLYGISAGIVATATLAMSKELIAAGSAAENLRLSLKAITGSAELGSRELEFIRQTAYNLGLEFDGVANGYKKLSAAAYGTALEGEPLRRIFEGMTSAAKSVGMTSEEVTRVFTQMAQMMSKGKVELEDLKVVSESLPGAMGVAKEVAKGMGGDLYEMMKNGKLVTSEFLVPFVDTLNSRFPLASEHTSSLSSEVSRLDNSWKNLKVTVMEGGGDGFFGTVVKGIRSMTDEMAEFYRTLDKTGTKWFAVMSPGLAYVTAKNFGAMDDYGKKQPAGRDPFSYSQDEIGTMRDTFARREGYRPDAPAGGNKSKTSTGLTEDQRIALAFGRADVRDFMASVWQENEASLAGESFGKIKDNSMARFTGKMPSFGVVSAAERGMMEANARGEMTPEQQAQLDRRIGDGALQSRNELAIQKEQEFMAMREDLRGNASAMELFRIEQERQAWENSWAMNTDSYEVYEQRMAVVDEVFAKKREKVAQNEAQTKLKWATSGFSSMGSMMESFYTLSNKKARWAFEAAKVMKIGETVTNTASAAMGAYNAMASIPYVGPVLGAAAAAAAVAAGAAQIASIQQQTPDGGTMPSSVAPGGGTYGAGTPTGPVVTQPMANVKNDASPTLNIVIHGNVVDGDKFARELIPSINKALKDGVT